MELRSESFKDGDVIPGRCAFAVPDAEDKISFSDNRNPQLGWRDLPEGTKSLAIICHDSDVPSKPDDVNVEGREVPADLERVDFFHWVLVDLSPEVSGIDEGEFSQEVTARGKDGPEGPKGTRQGINDYTNWFEGDEEMGGDYFGYDGPCPPWNDSIVHHYHFTAYALDTERVDVDGEFTGADVLEAIEGHVLDEARITGLYSLNPNVDV